MAHPNRVASPVEGRGLERQALILPDFGPSGGRIQKRFQRQFDQLGDFGWIRSPVGSRSAGGQPRRDREIAAKQIDGRQLAQQLDVVGAGPQLFLQFAKGGQLAPFARLDRSAGQTDLAGMIEPNRAAVA